MIEPGKRYPISVRVKQRDVEGNSPYIQVHSFDAAKKPSRLVFCTGRGGTQDWHELQAVISVPEDSVQCRIDFGMSGSKGTVWFDDVCLAPAREGSPPDRLPRVTPEVVHVTDVDLPRTAQPGRALDLTISLRPQQPLKRERYRFVLEMANRDVRLLLDTARSGDLRRCAGPRLAQPQDLPALPSATAVLSAK